jgi:membrane associated rhomboid family serine protease
MIPLKDENPTRTFPVVTLLLIAACVVVYFFFQPTGASILGRTQGEELEELEFTVKYAAIPCEVVKGRPLTILELQRTFEQGDQTACDAQADDASPPYEPDKNVYLAVLISMFLHGNLLHIAGNMLYLWVFGNNIEDAMGKVWFIAFYLAGGLAATIAHIAVDLNSTVPVVGASGAIAAVMGAYLVLFPNAPIKSLIIFYFIFFREITAKWLLGFWFISQFFLGSGSGVAWMAHVGGFVFGVLVGLLLRTRVRREREPLPWNYA